MSDLISKAKEDFVTIEDGYKVYWVSNKGFLTATQLREIADELDRLNKDWDEQVKNDPILIQWKYTTFEDWYNELLTHTIRSEWLESRSEELKAAFDAARKISNEGIDNTEN